MRKTAYCPNNSLTYFHFKIEIRKELLQNYANYKSVGGKEENEEPSRNFFDF